MSKEIEEMKKRIEAYKAERVAQGLPPSTPDPFVPVALATVLVERCEPLFQYIVKYAKLCNDAQAILPANVELFKQYKDYLTLIGCAEQSVNSFALGMLIARRVIDNAETFDSNTSYVRKLVQAINIAEFGHKVPFYQSAYNSKLTSLENHKLLAEAEREYKLLTTDEALFKAEVQKYLDHYETVKHLY